MSLCCRPAPRRLLGRILLGGLCVLLLLGIALASRGAVPDIPSLIRQLGHDDFERREAASQQLAELGEDSLAHLKVATKSGDAEIRRRAVELVGQIERKLFGEIAVLAGHSEGLWAAAFSPDGTRAVTCSDDKTLRVWEAGTGRLVCRFEMPSQTNCARFFRDGKRLLVGLANGHIGIYDAEGKLLHEVGKHTDEVVGVELLPGEVEAVSVSRDRTLKRWNLSKTEAVRTFVGHTEMIRNVAISPDGALAATAGFDGCVRLWNLADGDLVQSIRPEGGMVFGVRFSPDGKWLATGTSDHTVRVWDVETGEELQRFTGHTGFVYSVAFTRDGRRLLSACEDRSIRVWNLIDGTEVRAYLGHGDYVRCVELSPDGRCFLSASRDHTARLWSVPRE